MTKTVNARSARTPVRKTADPDQQVALNDPAIPLVIRAAVAPYLQPGCTLWRCPCHRPKGSNAMPAHHPDVMIEWWLLNTDGKLVECFWEESPPSRLPSPGMPGVLLLLFCLASLALVGGWGKTGLVPAAALVVLAAGWAAGLVFKLLSSR